MNKKSSPEGGAHTPARRLIMLSKGDRLRTITITPTPQGSTVHVYRDDGADPPAKTELRRGQLTGWLSRALAAAEKAKWAVAYDGPAAGDGRGNPFRAVQREMLDALHFGAPPPEDADRRTVILWNGRTLASVTIAATPEGPTLTHTLDDTLRTGQLTASPPEPQPDAASAERNAALVLARLRSAGWESFYDGRPLHG